MKKRILTVGLALLCTASLGAQAAKAIDPTQLGLSKTDVTDVPTPPPTVMHNKPPGAGNTLYYPGYDTAPPPIPHDIKGLVPVTLKNNMCLSCHLQPDKIGQKVPKGQPIPIPASHYQTGAYGKPEAGAKPTAHKGKLSGSRFVCTQCHRPQHDAPPLVENTFGK